MINISHSGLLPFFVYGEAHPSLQTSSFISHELNLCSLDISSNFRAKDNLGKMRSYKHMAVFLFVASLTVAVQGEHCNHHNDADDADDAGDDDKLTSCDLKRRFLLTNNNADNSILQHASHIITITINNTGTGDNNFDFK